MFLHQSFSVDGTTQGIPKFRLVCQQEGEYKGRQLLERFDFIHINKKTKNDISVLLPVQLCALIELRRPQLSPVLFYISADSEKIKRNKKASGSQSRNKKRIDNMVTCKTFKEYVKSDRKRRQKQVFNTTELVRTRMLQLPFPTYKYLLSISGTPKFIVDTVDTIISPAMIFFHPNLEDSNDSKRFMSLPLGFFYRDSWTEKKNTDLDNFLQMGYKKTSYFKGTKVVRKGMMDNIRKRTELNLQPTKNKSVLKEKQKKNTRKRVDNSSDYDDDSEMHDDADTDDDHGNDDDDGSIFDDDDAAVFTKKRKTPVQNEEASAVKRKTNRNSSCSSGGGGAVLKK